MTYAIELEYQICSNKKILLPHNDQLDTKGLYYKNIPDL